MKYIKKVDVTQLVTNTGTIIDSMNPGDNQHTNAPSIDAVKNYVEKYSTTETKIGTWIDGKPIYRKVLSGTIGSSGYTSVTHNLSIESVINIKGFCAVLNQTFSSNGYRPIPYFRRYI